jgi:hypothetical protein
MNAAPPFSPAMYGKRHTFPKPTAEPAVARIIPILLPKLALSECPFICLSFFIRYLTFYSIQLQKYKIILTFALK